MTGTSVYDEFRRRALTHPDREFIVHLAIRHTYAETLALADRCAGALLAAGVRAGDRVGILCSTRPEVSIVFLACAKIGALYVGLGARLRRSDLEYVLRDCSPAFIFAAATLDGVEYIRDIADISQRLGLRTPVALADLPEAGLDPAFVEFVELVPPGADAPSTASEQDGLLIVYTSGTTGPPKGALLSHRGMLNYRAMFRARPLDAPRLLSDMPIDHIGYAGNELMSGILTGGTIVQVPRFDAAAVADAIERERVTVWPGVIPTMLNRLVALEDLDRRDLSSLEWVWWAGQIAHRVAAAIQEIAGTVSSSYGMTEISCITITDVTDPLDVHVETVGRPLDDIELRIVPLAGDPTSPVGEIELRRTGVMLGYWGRPEATAESFTDDGWLRTGDLGYLDDTANLVLTGRSKLLIRSGGYNLSPVEIENVLQAHPEVAMAVVVGLPDPDYGEAAHAAWVAIPTSAVTDDELRAWARERLSGFKVPKRFHAHDELPLLSNGKADRAGIRALLTAGAMPTQ
jgi:acyl-CoA synthetase (AMP-forming)/AMP-acid ligase II